MEEYQEFLSKIVLIPSKILDLNTMTNEKVGLQIDAAYTINDQVTGLVFFFEKAS